MTKQQAILLIDSFHIPTNQDFNTLSGFAVNRVLDAAKLRQYRKPKLANGSTGRYFYAALMRAYNGSN
jgi:hypothetical protein